MGSADVLDLREELHAKRVRYWLDGGWGVDCLLGVQTRQHNDLDLVLRDPLGEDDFFVAPP